MYHKRLFKLYYIHYITLYIYSNKVIQYHYFKVVNVISIFTFKHTILQKRIL